MPDSSVPPTADSIAMARQWDDEGTMAQVAAQAENYPELLASRLTAFRTQRALSVDDLAAYLEVDRLNLFRLATCYAPSHGIARTAATKIVTLNEAHLATLLEQTRAADRA